MALHLAPSLPALGISVLPYTKMAPTCLLSPLPHSPETPALIEFGFYKPTSQGLDPVHGGQCNTLHQPSWFPNQHKCAFHHICDSTGLAQEGVRLVPLVLFHFDLTLDFSSYFAHIHNFLLSKTLDNFTIIMIPWMHHWVLCLGKWHQWERTFWWSSGNLGNPMSAEYKDI